MSSTSSLTMSPQLTPRHIFENVDTTNTKILPKVKGLSTQYKERETETSRKSEDINNVGRLNNPNNPLEAAAKNGNNMKTLTVHRAYVLLNNCLQSLLGKIEEIVSRIEGRTM